MDVRFRWLVDIVGLLGKTGNSEWVGWCLEGINDLFGYFNRVTEANTPSYFWSPYWKSLDIGKSKEFCNTKNFSNSHAYNIWEFAP